MSAVLKLVLGPLIVLTSSCAPTLYVYSDTPDMEPLIEAAGDPLGVRLRVVEQPGDGVVFLEFRDQAGKKCGRALETLVHPDSIGDALANGIIDCQPKAWSCDHPNYVAHELAHVIGLLQHVDQETLKNLMRPTPGLGEVELSKRQRAQLKTLVVAFNESCG